jgi:purine-binding chemotaxis protein CheW
MPTLEANTAALSALTGKYLTFMLNQEGYGIPVLKVREIIRGAVITRVPQVPHFIKGVINLRGKIIPVMDLCTRLGLAHADSMERACIIVVQVNGPGNKEIRVGLAVDGVEEVCQLAAADIEAPPDLGSGTDTTYIMGVAKFKGTVKTLLDLDRIVAGQ